MNPHFSQLASLDERFHSLSSRPKTLLKGQGLMTPFKR